MVKGDRMSAEEANKRIRVGDHVLAYIPENLAHPIQFLHYEFVVKEIDLGSKSVTLQNFQGEIWTYSLSMLNMILLQSSTPKVNKP